MSRRRWLALLVAVGAVTALAGVNRTGATIVVDAPGLALPAGATVTNDGTIRGIRI